MMTTPLATTAISTAAGAMLASPAGLEAFLETAGQFTVDEKAEIFEELRDPLRNFAGALEAQWAPTKELREILGHDEKVGGYLFVRSRLLHQSAAALMKLSSNPGRYRAAADQVIWKNNYVTRLETPPGERKKLFETIRKMENRLRSKESPEHEGSGGSLIYATETLNALFVGGLSGSMAMRNFNVGMPTWMSIIPGAICLFHLSDAAFFFSSLIHSLIHYEGIKKLQKSFFEKSYPYLAESALWGTVTLGIFSHSTSDVKYLTGLTALLTTVFGLLAGVRATLKIERS